MKTTGLIGGMSWESSLEYYRIINQLVRERHGGLHSARIVMHSFDFAEVATLQNEGDWDEIIKLMIGAAQRLERAGADFLVICTNTMHKVADVVQKDIRVPLLHIADATAEEIKSRGLEKVGLMGTRLTMEEDFYKERLIGRHGLEVMIPDEHERQIVNDVIYSELCRGEVTQSSRDKYGKIMQNLVASGSEGIILGCTEIGLLVDQQDVQVPVFDTTAIHAKSAARYALEL
ncbi:MAG: aspartate racemase [Planctomycetes bacterium B3_Pla]|nr:MAG: aspartate racemase [Planctomycetes bacterium B3_Pla]